MASMASCRSIPTVSRKGSSSSVTSWGMAMVLSGLLPQRRVSLGDERKDQCLRRQVGQPCGGPVGGAGDDDWPSGGEAVDGGLRDVLGRNPHELRQRLTRLVVADAGRL